MHQYGYFGSDSTVFRQSVKNGNEQRAYMLFDGVMDIIDGSRIAIDNGFTMHEAFSTQEDYTPGNVCSSSFEATLLNYDGALSSFNFKRSFALLLGVSYGSGHFTLNTPPSATLPIKACIVCSSITFELDSDSHLWYKGSKDENWVKLTKGASYDYSDVTAQGIFVVSTASTKHEVYAVDDQKKIWRITVDGNEGYVFDDVTERGSFTPSGGLSDLAYARLVDSTSRRTAERWYLSANKAWLYENVVNVDGSGYTTNNIMFSSVNCFDGQRPKKVFGKTIQFNAQDWNARLDTDASAYIKTAFTGAKTIMTIGTELYSPFGMTPAYAGISGAASLSGITYSKNPFEGLSGYTYRDLVAFVAESIGFNVRFETLTFTFDSNETSISTVPTPRFVPLTTSGYYLGQDEIYDYDTEEYGITPIQKIIVRQTENDVGIQYPADAAANANTWNIIDNPLFAQYATTEDMQTRMSYIWARIDGRSGGYRPGTVEAFSQLVLQAGDIFALTDENGATKAMIISQMTTVWNGMADCTIECVGRYRREEDSTNGYKEKLRIGRRYHDFIVDIESLVSEIGDMEGNINSLEQTSTQTISRLEDAEGNISTLGQSVGVVQSEVRSMQGHQIFRGTNTLDTLNPVGTPDNDWQNEKWTRGGVASQYSLVNLSTVDAPTIGIKRGVQLVSSPSADIMIYQDAIPLSKTAGVTTVYTMSFWVRVVSGTPAIDNPLIIECRENDSMTMTVSAPVSDFGWDHIVQQFDIDSRNARFGLGLAAGAGCTIQVCAMKLEIGRESTPWSEADSYTLTRITQTAEGIDTEITDVLENYYTKQETAQFVNTTMGNALGDYYNKNETASLVTTTMSDALNNYYTKNETAQLITEEMSDALGNYYNKTQTASLISESMSDALGNYYTKTQTASEISTYVGNNAYGIVSGISINAYGITLTGGKYVSVYAGSTNCAEIKDTTSGTIDHGISFTSYSDLKLIPRSGYYGGLSVAQFNGGLVLLPETTYGNQDGTISQYPCYLGMNLALDGWTEGYISDIYYSNAYEQSSRALKENIEPINISGDVIDALQPVSFNYKTDVKHQTHFGLIHEDTLPLLPEICKGDADADPEKKAINYIELVAILLKEVQSLRARVKALEGGN